MIILFKLGWNLGVYTHSCRSLSVNAPGCATVSTLAMGFTRQDLPSTSSHCPDSGIPRNLLPRNEVRVTRCSEPGTRAFCKVFDPARGVFEVGESLGEPLAI